MKSKKYNYKKSDRVLGSSSFLIRFEGGTISIASGPFQKKIFTKINSGNKKPKFLKLLFGIKKATFFGIKKRKRKRKGNSSCNSGDSRIDIISKFSSSRTEMPNTAACSKGIS
jgi:hypothetical protein